MNVSNGVYLLDGVALESQHLILVGFVNFENEQQILIVELEDFQLTNQIMFKPNRMAYTQNSAKRVIIDPNS